MQEFSRPIRSQRLARQQTPLAHSVSPQFALQLAPSQVTLPMHDIEPAQSMLVLAEAWLSTPLAQLPAPRQRASQFCAVGEHTRRPEHAARPMQSKSHSEARHMISLRHVSGCVHST